MCLMALVALVTSDSDTGCVFIHRARSDAQSSLPVVDGGGKVASPVQEMRTSQHSVPAQGEEQVGSQGPSEAPAGPMFPLRPGGH